MIRPSPADIAAATTWIDDHYRLTVDATWFARHRASLIRTAAMLEMGKRQDREHKEQFAPKQRRKAA